MNQYIHNKVREIAMEIISNALENGDALQVARELREGIRSGWHAALEDIDTPEVLAAKLKFPI